MKRYVRLPLALMLFTACSSQSPPGNVDITLTVDPAVSAAIKNSIVQIVFLIGQGSDKKLVYPEACRGCTDGADSCDASKECLNFIGCGYDPDLSTFAPEVSFSDVGEGKTMDIISCGLNSNQHPVIAGEGAAKNLDGKSSTITLTTTVTPCTVNLPPLCIQP